MVERRGQTRVRLWKENLLSRFKSATSENIGVITAEYSADNGMDLFGNVQEMRWIRDSLGTNPGGVFEDPKSGKKLYVKRYEDPLQASCEFISNRVYALTGAPMLRGYLVRDGDTYAYATEYEEQFKKVPAKKRERAKSFFVAAAYLADWDAVGTGPENPYGNLQQDKNKNMKLIDHGGSLLFQGLGGRKRSEDIRTDTVLEIESMRSSLNPRSREIFGDIIDSEIYSQSRVLVEAMSDERIEEILEQSAISDQPTREFLTHFLLGRKQALATKYRIDIGLSAEKIPLPAVQDLYDNYLAGAPGFGTFEEYLATHYPTASYAFTSKLAEKIGNFHLYDLDVYRGDLHLDQEATEQLKGVSTIKSEGREFVVAQIGSETHLLRRDAVEELYQLLQTDKMPKLAGLYHSTTFVITDSLIKQRALLSVEELRKRGIEPRSGEAITSFNSETKGPRFGNLKFVFVGEALDERYMSPRWFNLEERGLGIRFDRMGLKKHLKKPYKSYLDSSPNTTGGLMLGSVVPINNDTVSEINYDIEAKFLAERIQQELGITHAYLSSFQAREIYSNIVRQENIEYSKEMADYLEKLINSLPPIASPDSPDTVSLKEIRSGIDRRRWTYPWQRG